MVLTIRCTGQAGERGVGQYGRGMALNWDRINVWTHTYYTIVHSLYLAKQVEFGDLGCVDESFRDAGSWVTPNCSYASVLLDHDGGDKKLAFRRDPNKNFKAVSRQLVKMLIQDLVVILDEMLTEILQERGENAGPFPQSKLEKLATHLEPKYTWSYQGCLELVAVRNALTHNGGKWNRKSLNCIRGFVTPLPVEGESLSVGISMLFYYRKAMRTFLNEVKVA